MLTAYIRAALRRARYEILPDDGMFYGEIPGFEGVYAHTDTLEACRDGLLGPPTIFTTLDLSRYRIQANLLALADIFAGFCLVFIC